MSNVPRHIGYIVDGNRRWAKQHGLPAYEGHLAGYNALKDVVEATFDAGVDYVSAYIFSTENWKRSQDEVRRLMGLVLKLLTADLHFFHDNNIQLMIIGSREQLDDKLVAAIEAAEAATRQHDAGTLALCFNYGGQLELVDAYKKLVQEGVSAADITVDSITQHLYSPEIPACDLVVRTSGEQRLSNFMLWRAAYSELLFIEKQWPDMRADDVQALLTEYASRQRRFGG